MENRLNIEESPGPASSHTITGASSQFSSRCQACDDGDGDGDGDDGDGGEEMVMVIIVIMGCENKCSQ